MKIRNYLSLLIILILCSCTPLENQEDALLSVDPLPSPFNTSLPTDSEQNTSLPTETLLPTLVPTETPFPTNTPTEIPVELTECLQQGGSIHPEEIESSHLPYELEYILYLPPCYEITDNYYPVIYLFHGLFSGPEQWIRIGAVAAVDQLIADGEIPPVIVVFPQDRRWEPPSDTPLHLAIIEDLIPHIENNYRALPDRQFRAIGGLSRGGAWAVHIGFQYWEMFGRIGLHSPAIFWADQDDIIEWMESIPEDQRQNVYIDIADRDAAEIRDSTTFLMERMLGSDWPHEFYVFEGSHQEEYWALHIEQYIRFYTEEW